MRNNILNVEVWGTFKILSSEAEDLTPKSKKARALFALLLFSPKKMRTKAWLQDKLWSRHDDEQASDNFRQALYSLRKSLGGFKDILQSENGIVSLKEERIQIEKLPTEEASRGGMEFLEGLDINDPEFSDWIRDLRNSYELPDSLPRPSPEDAAGDVPIRIFAASEWFETSARIHPYSETLTDAISYSLIEMGNIAGANDIAPDQVYQRADLRLRTGGFYDGSNINLKMRIEAAFTGQTLWATSRNAPLAKFTQSKDREKSKLINQAVDIAIKQFAIRSAEANPNQHSAIVCFDAVERMFKLGKDNLIHADLLLERASDMTPHPVYDAWRGYHKLVNIGERLSTNKEADTEEAAHFVRKACAAAPYNSLCLALHSYVQSMVFQNYSAAAELAQEAVENSIHNPLGWAFLGISQAHLGYVERGYRNVVHAREICGSGPHRYQIETLACQVALMAGQSEDAKKFGEAAAAMAPNYAPPLRYLIAIALHENDAHQLELKLNQIRKIEPEFSTTLLVEPNYPVSALRKTAFFSQLKNIVGV